MEVISFKSNFSQIFNLSSLSIETIVRIFVRQRYNHAFEKPKSKSVEFIIYFHITYLQFEDLTFSIAISKLSTIKIKNDIKVGVAGGDKARVDKMKIESQITKPRLFDL